MVETVVASWSCGKDQCGRCLLQQITASGAGVAGVVTSRVALTTTKTRIIAHNQQVVRLDHEHNDEIDGQVRARVRTFLQKHCAEFDVLVVSDYGKGVGAAKVLELLVWLRQLRSLWYLTDRP